MRLPPSGIVGVRANRQEQNTQLEMSLSTKKTATDVPEETLASDQIKKVFVSQLHKLMQLTGNINEKTGKPKTTAFGKLVGVPYQTVDKWLGGSVPEGPLLLRISKATGKSINWLLTGEEVEGIYPLGISHKTKELLDKAATVLESKTHLANALATNIESFERSLEKEQKFDEMEKKLDTALGQIAILMSEKDQAKERASLLEKEVKEQDDISGESQKSESSVEKAS